MSADQDEDLLAVEQGEALAQMLASPGWEILAEIGERQAKTREDLLLLAAHQWPANAPSLEYLKGVVFGIRLIVTTPAHMVSESTRLRHEMQAKAQEEQEDNA